MFLVYIIRLAVCVYYTTLKNKELNDKKVVAIAGDLQLIFECSGSGEVEAIHSIIVANSLRNKA